MVRRPWPIIILAFAHIIAPFVNAIISSVMLDLSLLAYVEKVYETSPWWKFASHFLLLPLAGVAIYATKRWSYYVFIAIMLLMVFLSYREQENHPHSFSIELFFITTIFNILIVTYFLIPRVSRVYHDKRLRWWEQKARYNVDLKAHLNVVDQSHIVKVENISETGVKIDSRGLEVLKNDPLVLEIPHGEYPLQVEVEIAHKYQGKWGCRFIHSLKSRRQTRKLIKDLIDKGARSRTPIPPWTESLLEWLKGLFTSGKGAFPEVGQDD